MTKTKDDGFQPPQEPIEVGCLHCGMTYMSDKMVYEDRFGGGYEIWWCAMPSCDGRGFGWDIYPADDPMVAPAIRHRQRKDKATGFRPATRIGKSEEAKLRKGARRSH